MSEVKRLYLIKSERNGDKREYTVRSLIPPRHEATGSSIREALNNVENLTEEFERCVRCGCLTNVRKNAHIDYRSTYVEGVGQLCCKCASKLH